MAVTDIDRLALADDEAGAAGIATIPIAVDTQTLRPREAPPGSMKILTLGTLSYPPNADGVRWFLNEIYPRVRSALPDAGLTIVGKQPPPDFVEAAAADPSVRVTGYVPDLQPYMDEAALVVVPVRAGGGMRVRILEAFARGMPVVTTTVGLEGIDAEPGRDVLVADTPEALADAVREVLESEELQMRLSRSGRRLAEERYDWRVVLRQMDAVYERLGVE
jgi:glycosyltransferase involved in cell wall biosynthesis